MIIEVIRLNCRLPDLKGFYQLISIDLKLNLETINLVAGNQANASD